MTTIHKDDVTGEEYNRGDDMIEFGIAQGDMVLDSFDAHVTTLHDDPEAVAEHLHMAVDGWLEDTLEEMEDDAY